MARDDAFESWAKDNVEANKPKELEKEKHADLIEYVAKAMAIGNNGGEWNINYTEEHRGVWRKRARDIVHHIVGEILEKTFNITEGK